MGFGEGRCTWVEARHSECRVWIWKILHVKMIRNMPLGPKSTGRADIFKFKHKNNRAKQCVARHCSASSRYLSLNFQGHHGHCTGKDHGLEDLQSQVGFAIFQQEDIGVVPRYILSDFEGAK